MMNTVTTTTCWTDMTRYEIDYSFYRELECDSQNRTEQDNVKKIFM